MKTRHFAISTCHRFPSARATCLADSGGRARPSRSWISESIRAPCNRGAQRCRNCDTREKERRMRRTPSPDPTASPERVTVAVQETEGQDGENWPAAGLLDDQLSARTARRKMYRPSSPCPRVMVRMGDRRAGAYGIGSGDWSLAKGLMWPGAQGIGGAQQPCCCAPPCPS